MRKCVLFGTGSTGRRVLHEIDCEYDVIGFLDNDSSKWGTRVEGIPVLGDAKTCRNVEFDEVFVCSLPGMHIIRQQLIDAGIPGYKINTELISTQVNARINFIRDFAMINNKNQLANCAVAEGGVYQGEFSKEINACFPECVLYLFDTFEGFDKKDVELEHKEKFSALEANHIGNTSIDLVVSKLPHQEKAVVKSGYFPETAEGLENEMFFFVNLDFDLYNPTLEGLRFFFPRLVEGGVILIHDYFNPGYKGIKKAIDDYCEEIKRELKLLPIGDHCSIAVVK